MYRVEIELRRAIATPTALPAQDTPLTRGEGGSFGHYRDGEQVSL